jgi:hypothetical protein
VDGTPIQAGLRTLTSTFRLRTGGIGESTIVFRFHAVVDESDSLASRVTFDATAEERGRRMSVGVDDPRDPRQLSGAHALNPNDREAQGRVARLLDRLAALGVVVAPSRNQTAR